tara:strand:- start:440 stop:691 length:252 start_codon:yes stop_codon:yes gene_type:complete
MSSDKKEAICEILIELEITITKDDSSRDQVAQLIHQYIQEMKNFPTDYPFKVNKVSADYNFTLSDSDDETDLSKINLEKVIKV